MTTGEHMKSARKRAGFTQEKLSKVSGVHRLTISFAETNRCCPNIFNIICLADALKISIDEYIGRRAPSSSVDKKQVQ